MLAVSRSAHAHLLHDQIVAAVRAERAAAHTLAHLLAEFDADGLVDELGYGSLREYAWDQHELSSRKTSDLLRLGRELHDLPVLDEAFAAGRVEWTKARDLLKVVTPENEAGWVELAERVSSRKLEAAVIDAIHGEPPPEPADIKDPMWCQLQFRLRTADANMLRDALAVLRAQLGEDGGLSDGELLVALSQRALFEAGKTEEGPTGERFKVVLETCPSCERTEGLNEEADDTHVGEALCGMEVDDLRPGAEQGRLTRSIPPRIRRIAELRDGLRCAVPGCECRLWLDLHHMHAYSEGGTHDLDNLVLLCTPHHRLLHDGRLAIQPVEDGRLQYEFGSRRVLLGSPRGGRGHAVGGVRSP
jgi:hypothetical protein